MATPVVLDRTDRKILNLLRRNGRISNLELAQKVALSPTPCARRVHMLEQSGVITGYTATVDMARLGKGFTVFAAVHLANHTSAVVDAFEQRLRDIPEVLEAYMITGSSEYILKIATEDLHAYSDLQRQKLLTIPHVLTVDSMFILRQVKHAGLQEV